jgi:hypothetical protein
MSLVLVDNAKNIMSMPYRRSVAFIGGRKVSDGIVHQIHQIEGARAQPTLGLVHGNATIPVQNRFLSSPVS